jgi:hypothetical protein
MQNAARGIQKSHARRAGRLAVAAFCLLNAAFLAAGCATKAKAATTVPDGPPLAVPEPPPRVILLVEDIPAPPPPAPAEPPREVRSVSSAAAAAEERKVRDVMARAGRDLMRVDYQKLSGEGKLQYDQSKRFAVEAEQAIKEKNYVYAMTLADKAATLAGELAGR